jgi:hypothetical protein
MGLDGGVACSQVPQQGKPTAELSYFVAVAFSIKAGFLESGQLWDEIPTLESYKKQST